MYPFQTSLPTTPPLQTMYLLLGKMFKVPFSEKQEYHFVTRTARLASQSTRVHFALLSQLHRRGERRYPYSLEASM